MEWGEFVCVFGDGGREARNNLWKEMAKKWAEHIESDNSQTGGLDDYNYISNGIFPPPRKRKTTTFKKSKKKATTTACFMG